MGALTYNIVMKCYNGYMDLINFLTKLLEKDCDCAEITREECKKCPLQRILKNSDGKWVNCVESVLSQDYDSITKMNKEDIKIIYKKMIYLALINETIKKELIDD